MTALPAPNDTGSLELLEGLYGRRFPPSRKGTAPSPSELESLFEAASAVPDHGYLRPWRLVVVTGDARERLGDALAADAVAATGLPAQGERARAKAFAAPCLIVLIASMQPESSIPEWEQVVSASLAGYAMVLAAHSLGLGAVWKSTKLRDGEQLTSFCGCTERDAILGWVLAGTRDEDGGPPRKATRPEFDSSAYVTIVN